jgi:hypothetical protein
MKPCDWRRNFRAALPAILASLLAWTGNSLTRPALAQTAGQETLPSEKAYKNIQVLKGIPSSRFMDNMFYMAGSLGVSCNECHVNSTDFEKDDNPKKTTARRMIAMVRELNKDNFDGKNLVTCNTCHRGRAVPQPTLAFAAIRNSQAKKAPPAADAGPSLTVDQIFERYVSATCGSSACEKLETAVLTGSMLSSEGWTAPLRIYLTAPDKFLATFDIGWMSYNAFNGAQGWGQDNQDLHDVTGNHLVLLKRKSAVFHPSTLKEQYSRLTLRGKEKIDEHEAYAVEGVLPGADNEVLYFDAESGLLVRIQSSTETSLGMLPHEMDLRDYREVGGAKLPFEVDEFAPDFSSVYKLAEASHGVPIAKDLFDKPLKPRKGYPE